MTRAAGRIACGLQDHLELGNLDSKRDWGYAKDYVECMWRMLQQGEPDDYVIATGVQHTVREFAEWAFAFDGMEIGWEGEGADEKGYDRKTGKMVVCVNPEWFRPTDVVNLLGNPGKAKEKLGWIIFYRAIRLGYEMSNSDCILSVERVVKAEYCNEF